MKNERDKEGLEMRKKMLPIGRPSKLTKDDKEKLQTLLDRKIGSYVLAKCWENCYNIRVTPKTITNNCASSRLYDQRNEHKNLTHNEHIPIENVTHFIDGYTMANGSIALLHHARKRLDETPLLILLGDTKEPLYLKIYENKNETQLKFFYVIEEAHKKGLIPSGSILCMDRKYNQLIKWLKKKLQIEVVVYGKIYERPYNSQVERLFGNISKVIYKDMRFVEMLNNLGLKEYLKSLCDIYYWKNPNTMLQFIDDLKIKVEYSKTQTPILLTQE